MESIYNSDGYIIKITPLPEEEFNPEMTCRRAWFIGNNFGENNVEQLAKMYSFEETLGCKYDNSELDEAKENLWVK